MEKLEGNGAECMVQFIKDGCKGTVKAVDGSTLVDAFLWELKGRDWGLSWLTWPATYYPPEPAYKAATPGEALDAWMTGKEVQVKADADGDWLNLQKHNPGMTRSWMPHRQYRIRID